MITHLPLPDSNPVYPLLGFESSRHAYSGRSKVASEKAPEAGFEPEANARLHSRLRDSNPYEIASLLTFVRRRSARGGI